jgi:hypothetical protein
MLHLSLRSASEQQKTPGADEWGHQKKKECIAISMVQRSQLTPVVIPSSHCAMAANEA